MKGKPKKRLNALLTSKIVGIVFFISCDLIVICFLFMAIQTRRNVADSMSIAASYSEQLMNQIIQEAENINALIQSDSGVQTMLRNKYSNPTDIYKQRLDINGYLSMLEYNYAQSADAFYIVLDDERVFKSTNFPLRQENLIEQGWYKSLRSKDIPQWLKPYNESLVANNRRQDYVAVSYPLYNLRTGLSEGIILVEFRLHTIESIIQNGLILEQSGAAIVDASGSKIISIDGKSTAMGMTMEERVQLTNGWSVVFSCAIANLIFQRLKMLFVAVVALLAVSVLIARSVGRKVAHKVSDPIGELLEQMEAYDDVSGHIEASIPSDIYEMDCLIENYNRLLNRIAELFAELEKRQKEVKRSEFAALQAQINPHFLYNTLDNISWLIRRGRDEDALRTLMAFSQFFRISLNKGARMIPVRLEIRHAELYMNIQKMRFDEDFTFEIRNYLLVNDQDNIYVPKLILQPLIENAIIHGIQPRMGQGKIIVSIDRKDDILIFKVRDNGCGIDGEKLNRINQELDSPNLSKCNATSSSYGLSNINLRIKNVFGGEYGLKLDSVPNEYMEATITIPVNYDSQLDLH